MENYKALIFDFDGVILDSVNVKTEAFRKMYTQYGPTIEQKVVDYHLVNGGVSRFEKFRYYEETLLKRNITEKQIQMLAREFNALVFNGVINSEFIPGVLAFIKRNSIDKHLFICTGTPETEIKQILDKKQLTSFFQGVHGSPAKKAEIITTILEKYQYKNDEALFFGDAMTDYHAAIQTGIEFIGLTDKLGKHPFPDSTKTIRSFEELVKF